ncbi:MBL fold metallo-hydrolase [Bacillus tropicus]
MVSLIAFNVQGDAFLLEKEVKGKSNNYILVDGGQDEQFAEQYYKELKGKSINLVVCTHTDADHVNGIISFFKKGFTCEEIWLPALWTANLTEILNGDNKFLQELALELKEAIKKDDFSLRKYTEQTKEKIREEVNIANEKGNIRNIIDLEEIIDEFRSDKEKLLSFFNYNKILRYPSYYTFGEYENVGRLLSFFDFNDVFNFYDKPLLWKYSELTGNIIKYYSKIVTIVLYAILRGVKRIRWWEYVENNEIMKSKINNCNEILTPLCHKELKGVIKNYSKLYQYTLSKVNKESIVLLDKNDRILFSSDSDLEACKYIPKFVKGNEMLITSPHHGSRNNATAYQKIKKYLSSCGIQGIWIRTDSAHISMGDDFPKILLDNRYCVNCYQWDSDRKRRMKITSDNQYIQAVYKRTWVINKENCICQFGFLDKV